jgi:phasin family protein
MSESAQEKMARALEEQQAQWGAFASKALESSMKLFELNLKMAKQSLEEASQSARHLLSVKSPEQIFTVDQELIQERLNQVMAYASEIGEITSAFTSDLGKAAQSQFGHSFDKVTKLVEEVKPGVPVQKFFPQFGELNQGYDQWLDASKKIVESFGHTLPVAAVKPAPAKKPAAKAASNGRARAK